MSEVTSVNGHTGAVVLTAADVEAVPSSAEGQPGGVATLNGSGVLPEAQVPSSVESGSAKVAYVSPEGSDANNGHKWGTAYATISHALSQVGEGGVVYVAPNTTANPYEENTLKMLQGQILVLAGPAQCFIKLKAEQGNFIQDALWGTSIVGNTGWEIQGGCTLLSNKERSKSPSARRSEAGRKLDHHERAPNAHDGPSDSGFRCIH